MKQSIQLPVALLKAASLIVDQSENEFMHPFNFIHIQDSHIIGTNGHLMVYAPLQGIYDDFNLHIPKESVKHFINKLEANCPQLKEYPHVNLRCTVEYDVDTKVGLIHIPDYYGVYEAFKIDLQQPMRNWQGAIPTVQEEYKGNYVPFKGKYITCLEEIASLFGGTCKPILKLTGEKTAAIVELIHSEVNFDVNLLAMPWSKDVSAVKFCIGIMDDVDDAEFSHVHPAESVEIAVRAVKRLRAEMTHGFHDSNHSPEYCVQILAWQGTDQEYKDNMLYTEEWFNKPLRRYDNAEKAKEFMTALNEPVECYVGEIKIDARTPEEVDAFFLKHTETEALKS